MKTTILKRLFPFYAKEIITISQFNRLAQYIRLCYSINDIESTTSIVWDHTQEVSVAEFKRLLELLDYQTQLIDFCKTTFLENQYSTFQISSFLKMATNFECDAVLLHLEQNISFYNRNLSADHYRSIFNRMVIKRKMQLLLNSKKSIKI